MSTSTNGMLVYGYDLGGGDDEWKLLGLDDEYVLQRPWYDDEADDKDFTQAVEDTLLQAHGFVDTWKRDADNTAYFEARRAAEAAIGVVADTYCSDESPMYVIGAKVITVTRGSVVTIDWQELERERFKRDWDGKLSRALSVLDLTPIQPEPRWLLVSYWG